MSDTWIVLIALGWIACGVLSYGITFGYYQREYPRIAVKRVSMDRCFAALTGITGPVQLVIALCMYGPAKHGLKYR